MSDLNESSGEESESESEIEIVSVDDSETSTNELDEIAQQNQQYERLKLKRVNYGFENLTAPSQKRKKSDGAGTSKAKSQLRKIGNRNLNRNLNRKSTGKGKTPKGRGKTPKGSKVSKVPTAVTPNRAVNEPSSSKNSTASEASTANAKPNRTWKYKAISKTKYILEHFTINHIGDQMNAVCKICNKPVSGTLGNNSNLKSHLDHVST